MTDDGGAPRRRARVAGACLEDEDARTGARWGDAWPPAWVTRTGDGQEAQQVSFRVSVRGRRTGDVIL